MINQRLIQLSRTMILAGILATLAACSEDSGNGVSDSGTAPAFTADGASRQRSPMAELGYQLALLERELTEDEYNAIEQQEVVSILEEMELIASSFQAEQAGESHLFLQEDMTAFLDSLTQARIAAEGSPPRYYPAGKVAGGCVNCHKLSP